MANFLRHVVCFKFQVVKNIGDLAVEDAQKAFVQRLQKLETFGMAFYTVAVSPTNDTTVLCLPVSLVYCLQPDSSCFCNTVSRQGQKEQCTVGNWC